MASLIHCPHCGSRPKEEFTIVAMQRCCARRPMQRDEAWYRLCLSARQSARPHREYWHHTSGCRRWLVVERDTVTHAVAAVPDAADDSAEERRVDSAIVFRRRPHRSLATARLHLRRQAPCRALPATRSPRRCWPTAGMLVGRSFKYHRPRGILTAGRPSRMRLSPSAPADAREPNTRATMQELYDGLEARSQNRWPSLDFDIGASTACCRPFSAPDSTTRPSCGRRPSGRRSTSLSSARPRVLAARPMRPTRTRYEKSWAHCDLLVIGAGPTGLAAALTAGRAGPASSLSMKISNWAAASKRDRADWRKSRHSEVRTASWRSSKRCPMSASCLAPPSSAGTTAMSSARSNGCRSMLAPPTVQPVERLWRIVRNTRSLPLAPKNGRWCLAATTYLA